VRVCTADVGLGLRHAGDLNPDRSGPKPSAAFDALRLWEALHKPNRGAIRAALTRE
jgi:hypothetical protein